MNYKHIVFFTLAVLTWLLICQVAFAILQKGAVSRLVQSIEFQIREDVQTDDMGQISRSLSNLESLGLVRCIRLFRSGAPGQVILDTTFKSNCKNKPFWFLNGEGVSRDFPSFNGSTWTASFIAENSASFYWSLNLARAFGIIFVSFLGIGVSIYLRQASRISDLKLTIAQRIKEVARQVAHDIRSPLSAIRLSVARLGITDPVVVQATARLDSIANDLLSFDWESVGGVAPEAEGKKFVKLKELRASVLAIIEEAKVEASDRNLNVKFQFEDHISNPNLLVVANLDHLQRIISNLFNNSLDALSGEGDIKCTIQSSTIDVTISIQDTGCGIPHHVLSQIGKQQISSKKYGHGLGLFDTKRKVTEDWGGRFKLESKVGVGTIVFLILKIRP